MMISKSKIYRIARYTWVVCTFLLAMGEPIDERYWWVQLINFLHWIVAIVVCVRWAPQEEEVDDNEDF